MIDTHFSTLQIANLALSIILLITVFHFFNKRKNESAVYLLLFLFSLSLNIFSITLDPFVNTWDERYHMLVAKNTLASPLFPRLYNEKVVDIGYNYWNYSFVWLHKQPFFTWLMAFSHGIFGDSEWCYRVPSALFITLLTPVYYRTGSLFFSRETGLIAAVLAASAYFMHSMLCGMQGMDHNDIAFYSLISYSIWAFAEWTGKPSFKWAIAIGIFAGLAVLTKWLAGLWVFGGFFFYMLLSNQLKACWRHFALALVASIVIFSPWQIYAKSRWPEEYRREMRENFIHFTQVLDGHGGGSFFYFDSWNAMYGSLASLVIAAALLVFFIRLKNKSLSVSFLIMLAALYAIFTIAKTKMQTFVYPGSFLIYLSLGVLFAEAAAMLGFLKKPLVFYALILALAIINFRLRQVEKIHALPLPARVTLLHNKKIYLKMKSDLPASSVLFNTSFFTPEAMFYTGFIAYEHIPDESQIDAVTSKDKIPVIVLNESEEIPDALKGKPLLKVFRCDYIRSF